MAERSVAHPTATFALAGSLILFQSALLTWCAIDDSPTLLEPNYLHGGLACLVSGRTGQMPQNPPLPQILFALPAYLSDPETTTDSIVSALSPATPVGDLTRNAQVEGIATFLARAGGHILSWIHLARVVSIIACLTTGALLSLVVTLDAGRRAGLWSILLWSLSTTAIAYGHVATADILAAFGATTLIAACFLCLRRPGPVTAFALGASQALAVGLKLTLLGLAPITAIWAVLSSMLSPAGRLLGRLLLAALAWTFGFWTALSLVFLPSLPLALESHAWKPESHLVRQLLEFTPSGVAIRWLPGVLVQGIDLQATRSLQDRTPCWVWGRRYEIPPPYYYLAALLMKETVGVLALLALGTGLTIGKLVRGRQSDVAVVGLAGAVAFLVVISTLRGVVQYRYVVPALPFLIAASAPGLAELRSARLRRLARALAVAAPLEIAWIAPFFLAAGNVVVGGPMGVSRFLGDDALDWGQDLYRVRRWIDAHPQYRVAGMVLRHAVSPELLGLVSEPPPERTEPPTSRARRGIIIASLAVVREHPPAPTVTQPFGNEIVLEWARTADLSAPLARISPGVWVFPAPKGTE